PTRGILDFPAQALLRFFDNHALLSTTGQHQWYTVQGGPVEYVRRLEASLRQRGVTIRTGAPVDAVRRDPNPMLRCHGSEWEGFDDVVFATHSDDTLSLLADASASERAALS